MRKTLLAVLRQREVAPALRRDGDCFRNYFAAPLKRLVTPITEIGDLDGALLGGMVLLGFSRCGQGLLAYSCDPMLDPAQNEADAHVQGDYFIHFFAWRGVGQPIAALMTCALFQAQRGPATLQGEALRLSVLQPPDCAYFIVHGASASGDGPEYLSLIPSPFLHPSSAAIGGRGHGTALHIQHWVSQATRRAQPLQLDQCFVAPGTLVIQEETRVSVLHMHAAYVPFDPSSRDGSVTDVFLDDDDDGSVRARGPIDGGDDEHGADGDVDGIDGDDDVDDDHSTASSSVATNPAAGATTASADHAHSQDQTLLPRTFTPLVLWMGSVTRAIKVQVAYSCVDVESVVFRLLRRIKTRGLRVQNYTMHMLSVLGKPRIIALLLLVLEFALPRPDDSGGVAVIPVTLALRDAPFRLEPLSWRPLTRFTCAEAAESACTALAERLRRQIAVPCSDAMSAYVLDNAPVHVGQSLGMVLHPCEPSAISGYQLVTPTVATLGTRTFDYPSSEASSGQVFPSDESDPDDGI